MLTTATPPQSRGPGTGPGLASKAMGTRKANEEKKNQGPGGITMGSSSKYH